MCQTVPEIQMRRKENSREESEKKKKVLFSRTVHIPGDVAPWWCPKLHKKMISVAVELLLCQNGLSAWAPSQLCLPKKNTVGILLHTTVSALSNLSPRHSPIPHISLVPSSVVPPSWTPIPPPSIRSITELWLSHFNIASGCNTQCLISLLKREGIIENSFSPLSNTPTV